MQIILPALSGILGYLSLKFATTPGSKINRKLPVVKFKWVQLLPTIRIHIRGRIVHLHHWFNFSLLLIISIFISSGFLDSSLTRGFLLGGVIQGLRFPDRNIFHKGS